MITPVLISQLNVDHVSVCEFLPDHHKYITEISHVERRNTAKITMIKTFKILLRVFIDVI